MRRSGIEQRLLPKHCNKENQRCDKRYDDKSLCRALVLVAEVSNWNERSRDQGNK